MSDMIYCGRGHRVAYTDYMDFIDMVFGFTTPEQKFLGLLPKLYREYRRPQDSNYVVTENDVIKAAVGAYDHEISVCGVKIACRGIGNVAVHPDTRGKGYMKDTMHAALADMIKDGIALSTLGGRRQRYQFFSYDRAGAAYTYSISKDNMRHVYGSLEAPFAVKVIEDPQDALIDGIMNIAATAPFVPTRAREDYLDIARTWHCRLLAFLDGDRLAGYCIMDGGNSISEIRAAKTEDFMLLVRSAYAFLGKGVVILLPAFDTAYLEAIDPVAEGVHLGASMSYTVLNYRLVLEAFFKLKLSYTSLQSGDITLLIHGYAGDERVHITVKDGDVAVTAVSDDTPVNYEMSHLEALSILFAPISPARDRMDILMRDWFPLPIWMYRADEV